MVTPINHVYVSMVTDFRNDSKKLVDQFIETHSDDFRDFVPIWKKFKFNLLYEQYSNQGLKYDFKEDTLQIAKTIMLNDHFVGGLYLMYSLYYVQGDPKSPIRIECHELNKMLLLVKEERRTLLQTCQPGYLFAKLVKNDAFSFVTFSRDFSMEGQNRARLVHIGQSTSTHNEKTVNPKDWLLSFLERNELIDDIRELEKTYISVKQGLKEEHPEMNLALDMVSDDIISDMVNNLTEEPLTAAETQVALGIGA